MANECHFTLGLLAAHVSLSDPILAWELAEQAGQSEDFYDGARAASTLHRWKVKVEGATAEAVRAHRPVSWVSGVPKLWSPTAVIARRLW